MPSQFIEQGDENKSGGDANQHEGPFIEPHDQSSRAVHNQDKSLFVDPHDQGSPATQQGIGHEVPPYQAYVEDVDNSSGHSQPSANLDDWFRLMLRPIDNTPCVDNGSINEAEGAASFILGSHPSS